MNSNNLFGLTIQIARELNHIEVVKVKKNSRENTSQQFHFLIIIDFESTCWENKNVNNLVEIIEFPAVLLNIKTGMIEEEFQQYVFPVENPVLSEFCTKLTGIKQVDVENGVPLGTCLMLFSNWVKQISEKRKISFHKPENGKENVCTFVTWSDWDLSVCLHNECDRKLLHKPKILNKWIDLRAVYREYYKRRPQGLRGALSELGLKFEGREHSGLCDARNTAFLAWRMIQDGAILRITKSIETKNTNVTTLKNWALNMQPKGDLLRTEKGGTIHIRQPLKTLNISKDQRSSTSPIPSTPINYKRSQNLRRLVLTKNEKENSSTVSIRKSNLPKSIMTGKTPVISKETNLQNGNMTTPITACSAPSSSCKKTPPLCKCGCRAARKMVSLPGPNQGRRFFTCAKRKSLGMVQASGCGFFRWET